MKMKIVDLFSGAGGLTEGFRKSNFEIISHVEKEFAASETLRLRDAYYYLKSKKKLAVYYAFLNGDVDENILFDKVPDTVFEKTINEEINQGNLEEIFSKIDHFAGNNDISGVIGGPPCQAYSTIGRARNAAKKNTDTRIYLYRYYIDFLKRYEPDFFVFENVKGLLSFKDLDGQMLFPKMQNEFREAGYALDYQIVNAAEYGVPQNRERVIIFGTPVKDSSKIESFFKILNEQKQSVVTLRTALEDMPFLHAGESVNEYRSVKNDYIVNHYRMDSDIPLTQNTARPNTKNDLDIYKEAVEKKEKGENLKYNEVSAEKRTHRHIDKFLDRYKALSWDLPSHTVVAHISKDGHHYIHPDIEQNRSITVREAARIQGFPDDFYFETSRTAAFKQIGNAVPPILSEKIAESIQKLFHS